MDLTYERLQWDSDFFGVGIGRVGFDGLEAGTVTPAMLADVDQLARADGVSCIYATVDPVDIDLTLVLQRAGYLLVEVAQDLRHPTSILDSYPDVDAVIRPGTPEDLERLAPEIEVLAPWSRYAVDPRFGPEVALRMYQVWAERAVGPDPDRFLVVAEHGDDLLGFTTGSELPGEVKRIDLIASSAAGAGVARCMVNHVFNQFGPVPSMGGPIAARNIVSLRFVLGMGYRMSTARYIYHRWLD